jgi:hypothetical protein
MAPSLRYFIWNALRVSHGGIRDAGAWAMCNVIIIEGYPCQGDEAPEPQDHHSREPPITVTSKFEACACAGCSEAGHV